MKPTDPSFFFRFLASGRHSVAGSHSRRMPTAQVDRHILSGQLPYLVEGRPKGGCSCLDSMGVGADEVDEPLFDQRLREPFDLRSERPCQASRGYLQQTAVIDQGPQHAGLVEDAMISFGVGKNPDQAV